MRLTTTAISLLLLASMGAKSFAADPDAVLLETRVGSETAEQASIVGGFLKGWGSEILYGPRLARAIEKTISRPAGISGGFLSRLKGTQADIARRKLVLHGDWSTIIETVEPIRRALVEYVGSIATDSKIRDAAFDALVLLMRAYQAHDTWQATRLASDVMVAFPDKTISEDTWGPAFSRFFASQADAFQHTRKYELAITAKAKACSIYVNEYKVGSSPRAEARLPEGKYRVFLSCAAGQSRVTEVNVPGNPSIEIDLDFDRALKTETDRALLAFTTESERDQSETRFASRIATSLNAATVVTIGVSSIDGRPALIGIVRTKSGTLLAAHQMIIADRQPTSAEAQELGEKLRAKQTRPVVAIAVTSAPAAIAPHVEERTPPKNPAPEMHTPEAISPAAPSLNMVTPQAQPPLSKRRGLPAWPGWATAGVGIAGIVAGGVLIAYDGRQSCSYPPSAPAGIQCPQLYDTGKQGIAYTTVGVVALTVGAVWGTVNTARGRR